MSKSLALLLKNAEETETNCALFSSHCNGVSCNDCIFDHNNSKEFDALIKKLEKDGGV